MRLSPQLLRALHCSLGLGYALRLNWCFYSNLFILRLLAHLFVKIPGPGDSEVTFLVFESSCRLLLPV